MRRWSAADRKRPTTCTHSWTDSNCSLSADPAQGVRDKYERILAYVWTADGTLVNRAILEHGHAEATGYGKSFAYSEDFTAAVDQAKETKVGRWNC